MHNTIAIYNIRAAEAQLMGVPMAVQARPALAALWRNSSVIIIIIIICSSSSMIICITSIITSIIAIPLFILY